MRASILSDRLPPQIDYHGYDTDAPYLEWARDKWRGRGSFHLGVFDATAADAYTDVDVIMLLGLLIIFRMQRPTMYLTSAQGFWLPMVES